jgi:acyl-CoA thioesterase YciA
MATPPNEAELVLSVMAKPADVDANGELCRGRIAELVDIAGGQLASRLASGSITTVALNVIVFKRPVSIGDSLNFYALLLQLGNTSITLRVDVYAERNPADARVVKVTQADVTYVAIDRQGRPRSLAANDVKAGDARNTMPADD